MVEATEEITFIDLYESDPADVLSNDDVDGSLVSDVEKLYRCDFTFCNINHSPRKLVLVGIPEHNCPFFVP